MNNKAIGIFDSGIGGLTVAKEIIKVLPHESIIYIGDTARVPYGPRSKEVVLEFTKELVNFLLKRNVKVLVVACNTISATCLEEIEEISPVPVIGVVKPTVKKSVKVTRNKKIGVIGTQGTIQSNAYENEIKALDSSVEVVSVSCPLFVPMAEEGLNNHEAARLIAQDYLDGIKAAGVDTLILGCTHYPLLYETIAEVLGDGVTLIDSAVPATEELKKLLTDKNLLSENHHPKLEFYVTDAPERVFKVAGRFFGEALNGRLKKVSLVD